MSEKKALEKVWDRVYEFTECVTWHRGSCPGYDTAQADALDAARALALAVLEEAMSKEHTVFTWHDLQRRIEALGK